VSWAGRQRIGDNRCQRRGAGPLARRPENVARFRAAIASCRDLNAKRNRLIQRRLGRWAPRWPPRAISATQQVAPALALRRRGKAARHRGAWRTTLLPPLASWSRRASRSKESSRDLTRSVYLAVGSATLAACPGAGNTSWSGSAPLGIPYTVTATNRHGLLVRMTYRTLGPITEQSPVPDCGPSTPGRPRF